MNSRGRHSAHRRRSGSCRSPHQAAANPKPAGAAQGCRSLAGWLARRHVGTGNGIGSWLPRPGERPGLQQRRRRPDQRSHRHHGGIRRPRRHSDDPHQPPRHQDRRKETAAVRPQPRRPAHPTATFTLAHPVALSPAFTSGAIITVTATGRLEMNGTSRLVTVTITCRRDGSAVQAAGSIPVAFSDWDIRAPAGFGFLGSLANHGVAEFLLVLRHSG